MSSTFTSQDYNGNFFLPPGFRATAAFFSTPKPVNLASVPGRAKDDVEKMIGITPELFT